MAVTVVGSIFDLTSSWRERVFNADFCCTKSILLRRTRSYPIKAVKGRWKNKDDKYNPYSEVDTAPPDLHKILSDFLEEARDFVGDGGPPRWFSPLECAAQAPASPLLLFLPGIDGTGLGLIRHHKKLAEIFDLWCLHIPVEDRTPAKDLVKLIERTVKSEHYRYPNRPIYLVGESIGACLALDVAARNPNIDFSLILANPATHVNNFMLQPLSGMLNVLPDGVPTLLEEILFGFKQGDPLTAISDAFSNEFSIHQMGGGMLRDLVAVSSNLPTLSRIFPKDTLLWKLEMLKSAISSANSHIYLVRAETLILVSGRDQWFLNEADIDRFSRTLPKCIVRKLNDKGQFLFFEDGVDLVTLIKCTCFYRHGKSHDYISDYISPTSFELRQQKEDHRLLIGATCPVMLSTLEDGTIVRSLEGLPSEGPVLYVGYHMLLGLELAPMIIQFLKERNIHLRGLAHPLIFNQDSALDILDQQMFDKYKIMGGVPVSSFNIYKLLRSKSHVLLYPGGVREALHRKGEEYKLFWPEHPEFVRVASKFGAKIVPFGVVGEDDICDIVLDFDDQKNIPILKDLMEWVTKEAGNLREGDESELGKQDCYLPGLVPKIPGRFYYYFGKPIETAGTKQELRDTEKAQELYSHVKSEVEQCIAYLKMKREHDPYRNLLSRMLYQASHGSSSEIPTFDL